MDTIDSDILAEIRFMEKNDISIRPARHEVVIVDKDLFKVPSTTSTRTERKTLESNDYFEYSDKNDLTPECHQPQTVPREVFLNTQPPDVPQPEPPPVIPDLSSQDSHPLTTPDEVLCSPNTIPDNVNTRPRREL